MFNKFFVDDVFIDLWVYKRVYNGMHPFTTNNMRFTHYCEQMIMRKKELVTQSASNSTGTTTPRWISLSTKGTRHNGECLSKTDGFTI